MTPAWFPMSDDIRGLARGFQIDPLSGCQTNLHSQKHISVCVCASWTSHYVSVCTAYVCVVIHCAIQLFCAV